MINDSIFEKDSDVFEKERELTIESLLFDKMQDVTIEGVVGAGNVYASSAGMLGNSDDTIDIEGFDMFDTLNPEEE